jgi:hypothetical protein
MLNYEQAYARAQTLAALTVLTLKMLQPVKPWIKDEPRKK